MAAAFFLHFVLHWTVLCAFAPSAEIASDEFTEPFTEIAQKIANSWFTSNPVHCLRSALVHHYHPPCMPFTPGKQQLILPCHEACCFYDGRHLQIDSWNKTRDGFESRAWDDAKDLIRGLHSEESEEDASSDDAGVELMRKG